MTSSPTFGGSKSHKRVFCVMFGMFDNGNRFQKGLQFLPLDEAIASRAVFVIVTGSDGRTETLFGPAK